MRVIIVVADGLQLAALGPYGNEWIATPHLNRLADDAVVFDQHFADVPQASDQSSIRRVRHTFPPDVRRSADWADTLRSAGIECIWSPTQTDRQAQSSQVDQALARLRRATSAVLVLDFQTLLPPWHPPEKFLAEQFEDWDFEDEPEPLFEPGLGLIDPNDEQTFARIQRTYAAVVRQFDDQLEALLDQLDRDDLLLVTAGRGQNLGEHGLIDDERPWLHEELVHLPLIVRLPGSAQAGRRISALTQPIDIGPTLAELFAIPRPEDWHGHSLLPLCHGAAGTRQYICAGLEAGMILEFALQTHDEKVILPQGESQRPSMYFVKPDDRWEINNVRQAYLERAEALERTLFEFVAASRQPGSLQVPPLPELTPMEQP